MPGINNIKIIKPLVHNITNIGKIAKAMKPAAKLPGMNSLKTAELLSRKLYPLAGNSSKVFEGIHRLSTLFTGYNPKVASKLARQSGRLIQRKGFRKLTTTVAKSIKQFRWRKIGIGKNIFSKVRPIRHMTW